MQDRVIKVFIVEDHPVTLQGITSVIHDEPDMEVCGTAQSPNEAFLQIENIKPDVVLIDLFLKEGSGFDLIKYVRNQLPSSKILVCSMFDKELVGYHVFRSGAHGFISKQEIVSKLVEAIQKVRQGGAYIDSQLIKMRSSGIRKTQEPELYKKIETLSTREFEVFQLLGLGCNTKTIAETLHLSMKTVQTHRYNIQSKLGLENKDQLLHHSIQWVQY